MQSEYEYGFDSGTPDYVFSLYKQKYITVDGEKVYVGPPERQGVAPGDFEAVEAFTPSLLPVFRAFWTDDVIAGYKTKMVAMFPESNPPT